MEHYLAVCICGVFGEHAFFVFCIYHQLGIDRSGRPI